MGQWRIVEKQPAHRPSRRNDIVDAAIRIFADKGYSEAAITDIAEAADVAVAAVYYHFSGKDDLFAAAMRASLDSISAVVIAARAAAGAASADGLRLAIDAVWDWIDDNPYGASLVHTHLPGTIRRSARSSRSCTSDAPSTTSATVHPPAPGRRPPASAPAPSPCERSSTR